MKKYMLIFSLDGNAAAKFSDDMSEIEQWRMDAECGLGCYCEVYERDIDEGYKLLYS